MEWNAMHGRAKKLTWTCVGGHRQRIFRSRCVVFFGGEVISVVLFISFFDYVAGQTGFGVGFFPFLQFPFHSLRGPSS